MKKILIVSSVILLVSAGLFSQTTGADATQTNTNYKMWLGFNIGFGLVTATTKPDNITLVKNSSYTGFFAHFELNYMFSKVIGIKFETGYQMFRSKWKTTATESQLIIGYLDVNMSVLFKFSSFRAWAGPVLGFNIFTEREFNDYYVKYADKKNIGFGFYAGVGYEIKIAHDVKIPLGLDFKMLISKPAESLTGVKPWGIYLKIGFLLGA